MPLVGVILGLAIGGSSLGAPQTVDLRYKGFEGCAGRFSYSGFYASLLPQGMNDGGPTAPTGAVKPRFFELICEVGDSGGPQRPYHGVMAKSSAKARSYDRIWVDWNSNGKYDPGECAQLRSRQGESSVFVPRKQPVIDGVHGPIRYRWVNEDLTIEPAGYREGVARISGRAVKVGVVDANLDGVYGGEGERGRGRDCLLIDYAGTGALTGGGGEAQYRSYPGDSAPLDESVLMPDKAFYNVRVSPSGRKMVLRKILQPMGAVSVKRGEIVELSLVGSHGDVVTRSLGGACPVPADTYRVTQGFVERGKWAYGLAFSEKTVTVRAGKTAQIDSGSPIKLSLTVRRSSGGYSFAVEMHTASGATVGGIYTPAGDSAPPPTLSIRDPRGRVVKGLSFQYG